MSNQVVLTIPTGYERITTVEDMPNCTHVLLADGELCEVRHDESETNRPFINVLVDDDSYGFTPYYESALKHHICLKKREPKRETGIVTVQLEEWGKLASMKGNVARILLSSNFAPGTQVKVTVEEVIQ